MTKDQLYAIDKMAFAIEQEIFKIFNKSDDLSEILHANKYNATISDADSMAMAVLRRGIDGHFTEISRIIERGGEE